MLGGVRADRGRDIRVADQSLTHECPAGELVAVDARSEAERRSARESIRESPADPPREAKPREQRNDRDGDAHCTKIRMPRSAVKNA
jgi:hypothetical protein